MGNVHPKKKKKENRSNFSDLLLKKCLLKSSNPKLEYLNTSTENFLKKNFTDRNIKGFDHFYFQFINTMNLFFPLFNVKISDLRLTLSVRKNENVSSVVPEKKEVVFVYFEVLLVLLNLRPLFT